MEQKRIPRILVARPGLKGGDRSAIISALAFRDAGFEVIYTGGHQTPQQIVSSAIQEDVDVIALSTLVSARGFSLQRLRELLKENGAEDITVISSGNFSMEDIPKTKQTRIERLVV
jgi:methylmalonyl-CoA mutase C-terminal domain/subunit